MCIRDRGVFRLSEYEQFLEAHAAAIGDFKQAQQAAFEAERERWRAAGVSEVGEMAVEVAEAADAQTFDGDVLSTEVSGSIWTVLVAAGDSVDAGQALVVVESMKMEVTLSAVRAGRIERLLCAEGQSVTAGQALLVMH